ncbi:UDP-N-acetylmuramoylalanine--D-glutamate ligase [Marinitoga hydrogenitolerans DSM 16785]|uniref:UDP-N-acetylmuramoylalanine--D-glutamate ligase n=1 Tax=Marinitoga hydrogenitolerans (strain DSM 16785 / JCM 12826 / AT1271) TaxID=1122195 RepID=A0A1M4TFA6_MARH1|nr:UDP-N-acetylmuramoyl-L-alanine--D-glutamate ligase [Marinitoga hydrogenitolerans]SHE43136.1 UDP-N-acetylmuramoylalanine--D-glutamate ligase [Marinitoga hydrogenitolerans DSM 16785]
MKICLVGYGLSNEALLKNILIKENVEISVSNNKPFSNKDIIFFENNGILYEDRHGDLLKNTDLAIISPGIPPTSLPIQIIKEKNIPYTTEIAYTWKKIKKENPQAMFIAITGTNGKSTTTKLIGHLLEDSYNIFVGGNLGTPLSNANFNKEIYVTEVSSFQLFWGNKFIPELSVLINLMPDHLDWHSSLDEYYYTKINLILKSIDNKGIGFVNSNLKSYINSNNKNLFFFGENGDYLWKNNMIETKNNINIKVENEVLSLDLYREDILAAVAVALNLDISKELIEKKIKSFKSLEHRLEYIGEYRGIKFFNDSKATNVHAAFSAYKSFKGKKYIALLSGRPKNEDMTDFLIELQNNAQKTLVFGEMANEIKKYPFFTNYIIEENLELAIRKAVSLAKKNYYIIFSPAGASYDLFKNYKERGKIFKKEVYKLMEMV